MKQFIKEDIPLFHNVEFKSKPGADPILIFFNGEDEEVERVQLAALKRDECNQLLLNKGFYKKTSEEGEVPVEFKSGPYMPKTEL